jgi:uncharacterized protein (TIGR00290 family)
MNRVVVSWSGGKDAATALWEVANDPERAVVELLTTVNAENGRVSMHGVRGDLLERQATSLGYPLRTVEIPPKAGNDEYERRFEPVVADYEERGIDHVVFADLFLEGVRDYRAERLDGRDVAGDWPLWGRDTADLVDSFLDAGFRARVACVDGSALDASFAGRELDRAFLEDLPDDVDPCGEHGEFHTFVYDGPTFDESIEVTAGETVSKSVGEGTYHYCDLRPADVTN